MAVKRSSTKMTKSSVKSHYSTQPKKSAQHFSLGHKQKGRNGKNYQVAMRGKHFVWKKCTIKNKCTNGIKQGPSPAPYGSKLSGGGKKRRSSKKRSTKRRSSKKRSTKRRSSKKRSSKKRSSKKRSSKKTLY